MTGVRAQIALDLIDLLPEGWEVIDHAADVDAVESDRPVVLVFRARLTPGPSIGLLRNEMQLWLLDEHTTPGDTDDSLDERLPVLLAALESLDYAEWTEAERGVLGVLHGYQITVNVTTTKE